MKNNYVYLPFKMTKALLLWVFLCMFMSLGSVSAQAKDLKVGLGHLDYAPFYFEEDGVIQGAAVEIAQNLSETLGHRLIFNRYPWKRVQRSLTVGEIDMMILYFRTLEREKNAVYVDLPHINESSFLILKKGSTIPHTANLKELQSYKFGHVKGYSHGLKYDNVDYLTKYVSNNEENLIKMLIRGRIDIAVGNKAVMLTHAKKYGLHTSITFIETPIDKGENFIAFSRKREDAYHLAAEYSAELRKFKTTSIYKDILIKYGFNLSAGM